MAATQKKVLMISPLFFPHQGGVEKHVFEISKRLQQKDCRVEIITSSHHSSLSLSEKIAGFEVHRFLYPKIKLIGLFVIWLKMLTYWRLVKKAHVIHIHDVMIWCLPLRLIFPKKKMILSIHGWEGTYPLPKKNVLLKQLSAKLANKVVCVGKYIEKYYQVTCDQVVYGGINDHFALKSNDSKDIQLMFVGRLEADTGLKMLLSSLHKMPKSKIDKIRIVFAGDGNLRSECEQFGTVAGWLDETELSAKLKRSYLVVAGGYLSALESLAAGCQVIALASNPLKKEYWQLSEISQWVRLVSSSSGLDELINPPALIKNIKSPASRSVLKKYCWKKMVLMYINLYEN